MKWREGVECGNGRSGERRGTQWREGAERVRQSQSMSCGLHRAEGVEAQKRQEDESPVIKMTGSRLSEKVTRFFFFFAV